MTVQIPIKGVIISNDYKDVYDWYGMESTAPKDIEDSLPINNESVELVINSPGGLVNAGSEIYTVLKEYKGEVIAKIVGQASSAASVVALAGDRVLISPTANYMLHNARIEVEGDHHTLRNQADANENISLGIANLYAKRTGMTMDEVIQMMDKTTYLNAQQAKEYGFVDEIMFEEKNEVISNSAENMLLPQSVISKARNMLKQQKPSIEITEEHINSIAEKVTEKLQQQNKLNKQPTNKRKVVFY